MQTFSRLCIQQFVCTFTRVHADRQTNTYHIAFAWRSKGCKRGGGDIDFSVDSLRGSPQGGIASAYTPQLGELTTFMLRARTHTRIALN